MDELKSFRSSRCEYRTHLKWIIAKVSKTLEEERDSPADIASLTDLREQLQRKRDILSKLDSSVSEYINEESELKAEVCETEEIQASISENISQISKFLESREGQLQKSPITTSNPLLQPTVQPVVTTEAVVQTQTVEISNVDDQPHHPLLVSSVSDQGTVDPPDPPNNEQIFLQQFPQEVVKALPAFPNSLYQTFLATLYNGSRSGTALKLQYIPTQV